MLIIIWSIVLAIVVSLFVFFAVGRQFSWNLFNFDFGFGGDRSSFITVQEQSFTEEEIAELSANWISGSVHITVGGSEIRVVQKANADLPEKYRANIERRGDSLSIQDRRGGFHLISFGGRPTDLEIYLPEKTYRSLDISTTSADIVSDPLRAGSLKIKTTSGEISTGGDVDTAEVTSVSGDLRLTGLKAMGRLTLSTTSGEISGDEMACADMKASTVSGDLRLAGAFTGSLDASTTSGEVSLDSSAAPSGMKAHSVSGGILLRIPPNSGFTLNFHSTSGKFYSDFETTGNGSTYTHGDGSRSYSANSTSGSVRLQKH